MNFKLSAFQLSLGINCKTHASKMGRYIIIYARKSRNMMKTFHVSLHSIHQRHTRKVLTDNPIEFG